MSISTNGLALSGPAAADYTPGGLRLSMRDLLTPLFYYRRILLTVLIVPILLGLVLALMSKPVYVASAKLLVLPGSDYIYSPTVGSVGSGITLGRDEIIQAEIQILSSVDLRQQVLEEIGSARIFPRLNPSAPNALALAADMLARNLTITDVPQSNVIEVDFRAGDPDVAADVVNRLIALYMKRRQQVFNNTTASFVVEQRDQFASRLQKAEDALASFTDAHQIGDYNQEFDLLIQRQNDLAANIWQTDQQIAGHKAQIAALTAEAAKTPQDMSLYTNTDRSQQFGSMTRDLLALQAQLRDAQAKYQPGFPLIRSLEQRVLQLQSQINASSPRETTEERRGPNPVYQQLSGMIVNLQGELSGLLVKRQDLTGNTDALRARVVELNNIGPQLREMQRTVSVLEDSYRSFAKKAEEARLSDNLKQQRDANVRIVEPAQPPVNGKSNRLLMLAAGIALGLVGAIATLIILLTLQQVAITVRDAEQAMELPVLVAVAEGGNRARPQTDKPRKRGHRGSFWKFRGARP
ncbi:MAG: Wzz/FepE/Etk N-terminal domain-containing protein [Parvibaculaceae bacterium]|nr:Wzz/FepE/Etk N-terminal domain-containing protein [Parvibaculaceae bacterium]